MATIGVLVFPNKEALQETLAELVKKMEETYRKVYLGIPVVKKKIKKADELVDIKFVLKSTASYILLVVRINLDVYPYSAYMMFDKLSKDMKKIMKQLGYDIEIKKVFATGC